MKTAVYGVKRTVNNVEINAPQAKWLRKRFRQTVRRHCHKCNPEASWDFNEAGDYVVTYDAADKKHKGVVTFTWAAFLEERVKGQSAEQLEAERLEAEQDEKDEATAAKFAKSAKKVA